MMKNNFTRKGKIRMLWTFTLLPAIQFAANGQTSHTVDVTNNKYTPAEITISQGD